MAKTLNKIIKLADQEILKIAAGEVIERPANIVKELVENSLDAQAKNITIKIINGGQDLIEISDDGLGMSIEDAKNSVLPHWTSKIKAVEDLYALSSFGFRGEALASINSVSQLTLTTKAKDSNEPGIKLEFKFGTLVSQEPVPADFGTTICVQNLFENTPARRKFLKQPETEFNQIVNVIQQFAISNPDVGFFVFKDEKFFLKAPSVQNLKDRACQLWDYSLSEGLMAINQELEHEIKISGLISDGSQLRYSKSGMFLFVNSRPVKDSLLSQAIVNGYQERLAEGRFPVCFVFLTVEASKIDINIHPRKEQVRFSNIAKICAFLKNSVKKTLEQNTLEQIKIEPAFKPFVWSVDNFQQLQESAEFDDKLEAPSPPGFLEERKAQFGQVFENEPEQKHFSSYRESFFQNPVSEPLYEFAQKFEQNKIALPKEDSGKILGQLMSTFILVERDEALVIIDQHAAHERIIYEKMKAKNCSLEGTRLIFPEILTFEVEQINFLEDCKAIFKDFGIELEKFSKNQMVLSASPCTLSSADTVKIIRKLIANLNVQEAQTLDDQELLNKLSEQLHAQIACKSAVKAGDSMDLASMTQLLADLERTENRFQCIHGRPTTWKIDKTTLYKHFLRPI